MRELASHGQAAPVALDRARAKGDRLTAQDIVVDVLEDLGAVLVAQRLGSVARSSTTSERASASSATADGTPSSAKLDGRLPQLDVDDQVVADASAPRPRGRCGPASCRCQGRGCVCQTRGHGRGPRKPQRSDPATASRAGWQPVSTSRALRHNLRPATASPQIASSHGCLANQSVVGASGPEAGRRRSSA